MSTVDTNATAIDTVTEGIDKVDISDSNNDDISEVVQEMCAACGKEGNSKNMNICNKCKMVKYCNAACKKKHRKKHKKACEKRVAELHEEALFKEPPPNEECTICMLPLPNEADQVSFQTCCGKVICNGCMYAMKMREGIGICAFCRTRRTTSNDEVIKELHKLMDNRNAYSFNFLAILYKNGMRGLPQDHQKANELYLKAGELGFATGFYNLGVAYDNGTGLEMDKKKANHYFELAAMGGNVQARHNLGCDEYATGNYHRALKHFIIAARTGNERSLDVVKDGFMNGVITKDKYADMLRAYHERQKEMKSDARDEAVASGIFTSG